jgi:hypothetical protein
MDALKVILPADLARLVLAYTPATAIEAATTSTSDQVQVIRLLTKRHTSALAVERIPIILAHLGALLGVVTDSTCIHRVIAHVPDAVLANEFSASKATLSRIAQVQNLPFRLVTCTPIALWLDAIVGISSYNDHMFIPFPPELRTKAVAKLKMQPFNAGP